MTETNLKKQFKKLCTDLNFSEFKNFEKIVPESFKNNSFKEKQVKWTQLHNKTIIASFDKFSNIRLLLVKTNKDKYEIFIIDTERVVFEIYSPFLYKML